MFLVMFITLMFLTLTFSIYIIIPVALCILLYTFIAPLLSHISHSKTYFVLLPAPYIGAWFISMMFSISFSLQNVYFIYLVSAIPVIIVTLMHLFSRMRNILLGRIYLSSLARIGFMEASLIFLLIGPSVLRSEPLKLEPFNKVVFYVLLLVLYCSFSITYVNSAYRYRVMCKVLKANKIEDKIDVMWKKLTQKFPNKKEDVELIRYYFFDAIRQFEEGSYESAFLSAYKIIREKTVVDPRNYISDKREGDPSSFSQIRAILVHSRRKHTEISPKTIRETKIKLPKYALEVIERGAEFLEKIALD